MSLTLICSRSVARRRALPRTLLRFHACGGAVTGTLWSGMSKSSTPPAMTMTLCRIIGRAGGGAVADEQRRQSPGLPICQAGLKAEDAEPLGHPSLGSEPPRKCSKSRNLLLNWFMISLLEIVFF